MTTSYLTSIVKQFEYYKSLGEKTFDQLTDADIHWQYNSEINSIAIVTKHIVGNKMVRKLGVSVTKNLKTLIQIKKKCFRHGTQVGIAYSMLSNR